MPEVEICRWDDPRLDPERIRLLADLDHVFFMSSARQSFASPEERAEFRERWLGRYLLHFPQYALVALSDSQNAIGYVAGSVDDPGRDPVFADLSFLSAFRDLTARYPAQLHVNLDAAWRGRGVGSRLVDSFSDLARDAGAPGVHVVTARGMRNIGFYITNGFFERGAAMINDRELVFLGRDL